MKKINKIILILMMCGAMAMNNVSKASIFQRELPNGMVVLIEENHSSPVITIEVFVKTGSIYEQEFMGSGISHYFEHLAGDGTKTRTKEEITRLDEEMGNASNAYTTKNVTAYYRTTSSQYFDLALDLMIDNIFNATFPEKEVEAQRGVILNEIAMGMDTPRTYLYDLFYRTAFLIHPTRHPIIGYKEIFEKITRQDILTYYNQMYVPNNMILVIVGDVNAEEAFEKVAKLTEPYPRKPLPPIVLPQEPLQIAPRKVIEERGVISAYLVMGYHTVPISHPDMYPLDLLSFILSAGESSRLRRVIRDEKQLVTTITSYSYTPDFDAGLFGVSATLEPEKINEAEKAILDEIEKLKVELIPEKELEKAKVQKESVQYFALQTTEDRADSIGWDYLTTGNPLFKDIYIENIKKVNAEQIREVARKYFLNNNLTTVILVPRGYSASEKKEKSAIEQKKVVKEVLPNGIRLLLSENHTTPTVSIFAAFRGGLRMENEKNNGVSNFMANMLLKGTRNRTAAEIAELVDSIGATLNATAGNDTVTIDMDILSKDIEIGLDLFSDIIQNPTFPEDEFEKMQNRLIAMAKRIDDDWTQEAFRIFKENFYTRHPYKYLTIGTPETLKMLKPDDLEKVYEKTITPDNFVLSIFGDIKKDEVSKIVREKFAGFNRAPFKEPKTYKEKPLKESKKIKAKTKKEQSVLIIGYQGMEPNDEDVYAMEVLDAILSGIHLPGGRLHFRLRDNKLVYLVHAFNNPRLDGGLFAAYAASTPEGIQQVEQIMLEEFKRIKEEPVSEEELERGKKICITTHQIYEAQTNDQQATIRALDELYGVGYDEDDRYVEKIQAITASDILKVAQKYFTNYLMLITEPELEK